MTEYGLIGKILSHSFSADFFNAKFAAEGIDARYELMQIPDIAELPELIRQHPDLRGLNVTIPFKQEVIPFLDSLSEQASEIGAVNVIQFADGRLIGHNSDVFGFMESIRPLLPVDARKALVLGTGGASRAVHYGLRQLGLETVAVSRSPRSGCITYADISPELMDESLVIVNCTPLGTFPNTEVCADIPYDLLTPRHLLYDLVYNPERTLFLRKGETQGARVKNGLEMLHLQAIKAWEIWNSPLPAQPS